GPVMAGELADGRTRVLERAGDVPVEERGLGQQQPYLRQLDPPAFLLELDDRAFRGLPRLQHQPDRQQQFAAVLEQRTDLRVEPADAPLGAVEVVERGWYVAARRQHESEVGVGEPD